MEENGEELPPLPVDVDLDGVPVARGGTVGFPQSLRAVTGRRLWLTALVVVIIALPILGQARVNRAMHDHETAIEERDRQIAALERRLADEKLAGEARGRDIVTLRDQVIRLGGTPVVTAPTPRAGTVSRGPPGPSGHPGATGPPGPAPTPRPSASPPPSTVAPSTPIPTATPCPLSVCLPIGVP